jgi:hypothetical protein
VDGLPLAEWQIANGTYNRPTKVFWEIGWTFVESKIASQSPQCLYDFHQRASDTDEYNLFRYCARGYFFNGKDYDDDNRLAMRKSLDKLGNQDYLGMFGICRLAPLFGPRPAQLRDQRQTGGGQGTADPRL